VFGRYMATTDTRPVPFALTGNLLTTIFGGRDNLSQSYTIGETSLLSPSTVNSFRLAVNRTGIRRLGSNYFNAPSLGVNVFNYLSGFTLVTVTGGLSLGNLVQTDATYRTTTYQIADDFSLVHGTHQMSFGGSLAHWRSNTYANVRANGVFQFNGQATGLGMADFLTGNLFFFQQSTPNFLIMREWYSGLYAQDTWKATPRLTVNYGVRWEPYSPESLTKGTVYNFDLDRFRKGVKSAQFKNAPAGFYYPGDLDALRAAGAELVMFDTLHDAQLPAVDGLFIGGGFPETQMDALAANGNLRREVRNVIENGMPAYAECGGLMYLARGIEWNGRVAEMAGVIPADIVMHDRPVGRGYVHLRETGRGLWPQTKNVLTQAHEFHYSSVENLPGDVEFAYEVVRGHGIDGKHDGIVYKNLLASYTHLRDVAGNRWAARFVDFVRRHKENATAPHVVA